MDNVGEHAVFELFGVMALSAGTFWRLVAEVQRKSEFALNQCFLHNFRG